jgi:hypothetical protein
MFQNKGSFLVLSVWMSISRFGKFSVILLNIFSMPLACTSYPSMPMIHRFGLFMVSQRSCIFHLYFLIPFFLSLSGCSNSCNLCSNPNTLFSIDLVFWKGF